jgi:Yip1 domain
MTATAPKERPPSVFEDLLEIFYAPTAVFRRRRDTPAFFLALLIYGALIIGLTLAFKGMMEPIFDAEFKRGMALAMKQNPQLTPEMVDKAHGMAAKFMIVGVSFYALVTPMLMGLVAWGVGKIVGSVAEVGQMMMLGTYAMFPRVIESITGAAQTLFVPEEALNSRYALQFGAARFLDPDTTNLLLLAVVGRLDLFTLWITLLFGIGLHVLGKVPKGMAAFGAILVWFVGGIPAFWGAVRAMA